MSFVLVAATAGLLIGVCLGALGGGGAILATPVLVYAVHQSPAAATTGALVVVAVTSLIGAVTAWRLGNVLPGPGLAFGALAVIGAAAGARASAHVPGPVLLACFSAVMIVAGALMLARTIRPTAHRRAATGGPIITFRPAFTCHCPRAMAVLVTATGAGLLTGFLGVGGGLLVVPALTVVLALPMRYAAGTALLVISITSTVALAVRVGAGPQPDWTPILLLTAASAVGGFAGARMAGRLNAKALSAAFTAIVLLIGAFTAARTMPVLV